MHLWKDNLIGSQAFPPPTQVWFVLFFNKIYIKYVLILLDFHQESES